MADKYDYKQKLGTSLGTIASGAASGTITGAGLGSTFAGAGAVPGAIAGGVLGLGAGIADVVSNNQKLKDAAEQQRILDEKLNSPVVYDQFLQQQGMMQGLNNEYAMDNARDNASRMGLLPGESQDIMNSAIAQSTMSNASVRPELYLAAQQADRERRNMLMGEAAGKQALANNTELGTPNMEMLAAAAQGAGYLMNRKASTSGAGAAPNIEYDGNPAPPSMPFDNYQPMQLGQPPGGTTVVYGDKNKTAVPAPQVSQPTGGLQATPATGGVPAQTPVAATAPKTPVEAQPASGAPSAQAAPPNGVAVPQSASNGPSGAPGAAPGAPGAEPAPTAPPVNPQVSQQQQRVTSDSALIGKIAGKAAAEVGPVPTPRAVEAANNGDIEGLFAIAGGGGGMFSAPPLPAEAMESLDGLARQVDPGQFGILSQQEQAAYASLGESGLSEIMGLGDFNRDFATSQQAEAIIRSSPQDRPAAIEAFKQAGLARGMSEEDITASLQAVLMEASGSDAFGGV